MWFGQERDDRFERMILPHLDAGFNLARWLVHNDQDAEDVVQEACLRALRFFDTLRGNDGRAWFLSIVRNTSYTWMSSRQTRQNRQCAVDDETMEGGRDASATDPERITEERMNAEMLHKALEELPEDLREVIVLRELESCSYKEIAQITGVPMGTVMSRLARARALLQKIVIQQTKEGLP